MTSLQTYQFYTRDINVARERIRDDPIVSREMAYYRENVGLISTVDEFLEDDRIYNYAMKAFGLEELSYAKGLIKKVLESDLNDTDSFANRLEDTRYKKLAAAFDFGKTIATKEIQTDDQFEDTIDLYSTSIDRRDSIINEDLRYYEAAIKVATNVSDVFNNQRLRDQLFQAYDIDPDTFSYDVIKSVLTSDADDPLSYVNTEFTDNVSAWQTELSNLYAERSNATSEAEYRKKTYSIDQYQKYVDRADAYLDMAKSFNFSADGTLATGVVAQTDEQIVEFKEKVILAEPELTRGAMLLNQEFFRERLTTTTTVEDLVYNIRSSEILLASFGLPQATSFTEMIWAMTEDISDPSHEIYSKNSGFVALANAFNFNTDGTIPAGQEVQTAAQTDEMMGLYSTRYDDLDEERRLDQTGQFSRYIRFTKDLDDLMSGLAAAKTIREYLLKANDIGPDELSTFQMKKIFSSDLSDPDSYVNQLGDERYRNLAKSVNFDEKGNISSPRFAQDENEMTRITKDYYTQLTMFDSTTETRAKAEEEVAYYRERMGKIETVGALVADKRLVEFIAVSEGLKYDDLDDGVLGQLLMSDLEDNNSYANSFDDVKFKKIAGSFRFDELGRIEKPSALGVQSQRGLIESNNLYVTQTMEEEAGESEVGARLALYFERTAPTIRSVYELLADQALGDFIRTTLSIPAETASSDIDKQAQMLKNRFDIEDLQDPEKVKTMVERFLVLFDLDNYTSDPIVDVFNGATSFSAETLSSFAQLRARG